MKTNNRYKLDLLAYQYQNSKANIESRVHSTNTSIVCKSRPISRPSANSKKPKKSSFLILIVHFVMDVMDKQES